MIAAVLAPSTEATACNDCYPTTEQVRAALEAEFPGDAAVLAIAECESEMGRNLYAYAADNPNQGPLQLHEATWRPFFERLGWEWRRVVYDPATHARAVRIIYERGGWEQWGCGR